MLSHEQLSEGKAPDVAAGIAILNEKLEYARQFPLIKVNILPLGEELLECDAVEGS